MNRLARAAAAALTAAAVAGSGAAVAQDGGGNPMTRDSERYLREECKWLVDETTGNALRKANGDPIPVLDASGKQVCTVEEVTPAVAMQGARKASSTTKKAEGEPTWTDEPASSELGVGAIVGIVGAVIAAVVGLTWLFIEDFNVRLVPATR